MDGVAITCTCSVDAYYRFSDIPILIMVLPSPYYQSMQKAVLGPNI